MQHTAAPFVIETQTSELVRLRSVVESGFMHDWILRIEHCGACGNSGSGWREWCEPAFAISNASKLLADVAECRMRHPAHAIRLRAEKLNPRTQMIYCIYREGETINPVVQTVPAPVAGMQAANDRPGAFTAGLVSFGGNSWLVAIAISLLLSSLFIIEA